jgi:hypothetical protein
VAPGDRPVGQGGPADFDPGEHPEDGAEHRVPGDRSGESKELRMVADGDSLGPSVAGGHGARAVDDGQETRQQPGGRSGHGEQGGPRGEDSCRNEAADPILSRSGECFAPSRPTFYRKRIVSQRERENAGNAGQELVCNLCYLSPVLCNDKQSPGAMQAALSPTWRIKDARKGGERVGVYTFIGV